MLTGLLLGECQRLRVLFSRAIWSMVTSTAIAFGVISVAHAQDTEPRAYSNAPIGVNVLIAGYAFTEGALPFDASLPVKNAQLRTSNPLLAYARVLDLWGVTGKFDVIVPYSMLSGTAELLGNPVERNVDGFADPRFRLSVNLYGSPALTLEEFKDFEQDLIIGASLQISAPAGQYDDSRLININNAIFAHAERSTSTDPSLPRRGTVELKRHERSIDEAQLVGVFNGGDHPGGSHVSLLREPCQV